MEGSVSRSGRLTPGKKPSQYPRNISLFGVPEIVWMFCRTEKFPGFKPCITQPIALPADQLSYPSSQFHIVRHSRELQESFYTFVLSVKTVFIYCSSSNLCGIPIPPALNHSSELNVQQQHAMLQIHFTHQYFCLFCAVVLGQLNSEFLVQHSQHTPFSEPGHKMLADVMIVT